MESSRGVVAAGVVVLVGWAAPAWSACWWSTTGWRPNRADRLIAVWVHLFEPDKIRGSGLSGPAFATTVVALAAAVLAVAVVGGTWMARRRTGRERGLACGSDLDRFSGRAIVRHSSVILGDRDPDPTHAGVRVGRERYSRRDIWLSKESTILVLAPPRSGKTSGTVAPAVIDHHGPVVVTGVREDIMVWTHPWRHARGEGFQSRQQVGSPF